MIAGGYASLTAGGYASLTRRLMSSAPMGR